ncbi:hypothetical protein GCK32_021981 [Trichostrongylus colubriformis]|uniref:Uncharacterized protein n=1 Tax=Trichostrongylus colubriformis TaxID=6319 RepID=A0AAN8G4H9_TRICO
MSALSFLSHALSTPNSSPFPQMSGDELREIPLSGVEQHSTDGSCWIVLHDKVSFFHCNCVNLGIVACSFDFPYCNCCVFMGN